VVWVIRAALGGASGVSRDEMELREEGLGILEGLEGICGE
jgi:hypothetical protein